MNFKTTLVLLVLVVIGGVIWYLAGEAPPPEEQKPGVAIDTSRPRYLLDPRPEANQIVHVEFERRDQPTLVFERSPRKDDPERMEDWRMIAPLNSATENYLVNGLVTLLTGLQSHRTFTPGSEGAPSAAEAGLDPPRAVLTIQDKEGKSYGIQIGKRLALSNDTYVRVVGREEIAVVGRDLTRDIEREVNEYRAKTLFRISRNDARQVRVEYQGQTYDLTRRGEDEWIINSPIRAYARAEAVRSLVGALGSVRVKEYIDDQPASLAEYGLDPPVLTISVTTEKKKLVTEPPASQPETQPTSEPIEPRFELVSETHRLAVGEFADFESQTRYVKLPDQPWVATADNSQLERLIPKLKDLRDPRLTRVKADDITRLEIAGGPGSVVLEQSDGKWHGSGDLAELELSAVRKLLEAFEDVRAIEYIDEPGDLAQYGLDEPRATVTATAAGAVEPVTLRIGADTPSGRNTYVQVAGHPAVAVITAERARELAVAPLTLRSRVITSLDAENITAVTLERKGQRYVLERGAADQQWRLLEPADAPVDATGVRELVNDLARLRAARVVAKGDYETYGLSEPALTVRFVVEQPAPASETQPATQPTTLAASQPTAPQRVEHQLQVSRRHGKTYARFDELPYVFELDETVYKVLTGELIRRGLFDIDAGDVSYVKIEAPGGTVEFAREDDGWTYPPDPYVRLSRKRVDELVKMLAELRVSAYIAYREGDLRAQGLADAPVTVTLRLEDDSAITLKVDQVRRGELPRKAAWVEQQRIFLLRQAEAEKLMRGLDYYVKETEAEEED